MVSGIAARKIAKKKKRVCVPLKFIVQLNIIKSIGIGFAFGSNVSYFFYSFLNRLFLFCLFPASTERALAMNIFFLLFLAPFFLFFCSCLCNTFHMVIYIWLCLFHVFLVIYLVSCILNMFLARVNWFSMTKSKSVQYLLLVL